MSISQILNRGGGFPEEAAIYSQAPAPTSLSPAKAAPKQIHRNRASYSCFSCRRRKIKCDRQHPICGGCTKMGFACEWSDNSQTSPNVPKEIKKNHQQNDGANSATNSPRGHKRQRTQDGPMTSEDSSDSPVEERLPFPGSPYNFGPMMRGYDANGYNDGEYTANSATLGRLGQGAVSSTKEHQLEAGMSRLAEIVDKWYRYSYAKEGDKSGLSRDLDDLQRMKIGMSVDGRSPYSGSEGTHAHTIELPGGIRSPASSTAGRNHQPIDGMTRQEQPRPGPLEPGFILDASPSAMCRVKMANTVEALGNAAAANTTPPDSMPSPTSPQQHNSSDPNIDPRITGTSEHAKERERLRAITDIVTTPKPDGPQAGVDDLALGHLSIQEDGRSRYVGSTFWAFISNEISELNQVLQSHNTDNELRQQAPPLEERVATLSEGRSILEDPSVARKSSSPSACQFDTPDSMNSVNTKNSPINPAEILTNTLDITTHPDGSATVTHIYGHRQLQDGHASELVTDTTMLKHLIPPDHSTNNACRVIPKILKFLPTNLQCKELFKSFVQNVHPILPLVHIPTFQRDFDAFFKWWPSRSSIPNTGPGKEFEMGPSFIPLLFAVFYCGALAISPKKFNEIFPAKGHTRASITTHLYCCTNVALTITTFPRSPTISSLIAFLLIQTCLIREEEPLTTCSFIGLAMRVAQSMGLHRDGALFRGFNEIEREVRRRVWWHIVYLDVQAAVANGLPPLGGSDKDGFDTRMPCELHDELITADGQNFTNEELLHDERDSHATCNGTANGLRKTKINPAMVAAVGRYEATIVLRRLVVKLFGIKAPAKNDITSMGETIFEMTKKLEARIARIPARGVPEMLFGPVDNTDVDDLSDAERTENFNGWARVMLSMLSDKAFGVLYQPFLKSTKSKVWNHARHCAIRSCHSSLRKYLHLSTAPQFQPYRWFVPGTIQPLHSTMILLLDLYERPHSPEATTGREVLDRVFDLFGTEGNGINKDDAESEDMFQRPLLEGGREAWKMMGRMRKKAYAKGGVDIDFKARENKPFNLHNTPTSQPDIAPHYQNMHYQDSTMNGSIDPNLDPSLHHAPPPRLNGIITEPPVNEHNIHFFYPPTVGGISSDASGAPIFVAPGMNVNMETKQVILQYEDHGTSYVNNDAAANTEMPMDVSTDDEFWQAWDTSANWLLTNETFEEYQNMFNSWDDNKEHSSNVMNI